MRRLTYWHQVRLGDWVDYRLVPECVVTDARGEAGMSREAFDAIFSEVQRLGFRYRLEQVTVERLGDCL